ncbi:hypothetical protein DBB_42850 [Desulfoluna spongiiphila]|nr:hypothetical protein DBB_42850 [Desulfoluna spongiiphila]
MGRKGLCQLSPAIVTLGFALRAPCVNEVAMLPQSLT